MKTKEILISGITGTTFMTLFSYLVSLAEGENFSEPERLGQLADRLMPKLDKTQSQVLGWLGHYSIGVLFVIIYVELWKRGKLKPDVKTTLWLGGLGGLLAVGAWKTIFKLHPFPPAMSFNKYYLQLIPAHLVFAIFAGIGYKIMQNNKPAYHRNLEYSE